MNETIGVKGGHNDYRRTLTITKKQKDKLKKYQEEKELKELEKEVKKKKVYTVIKTLPLIITGATLNELTKRKIEQERKEKERQRFTLERQLLKEEDLNVYKEEEEQSSESEEDL